MSTSNSSDSLIEQVIDLVESDDPQWVKRIAQTYFLRSTDLLALILISVENPEDPTRDQQKIVGVWKALVDKAVKKKQIIPLDHDTHTPITLKEANGWAWSLYLGDAVRFFDYYQGYLAHTCQQLIEHLYKANFPKEATEPLFRPELDESKINEIEDLRKENKELKVSLKGKIEERDRAAELFFGAIRHSFKKYDPTKRNEYLSRMREALENASVPADENTIRKYLQLGYEKNSRKPREI